MHITSRKDAIAAGVGQYFTGKPCRKGHLANRYTQSGTCAACVAIATSKSRGITHSGVVLPREQREAERNEKFQALLKTRQEKSDAFKALEPIKIPAMPQDVATVFDTAVELCLAAFPCLERSDVMPARTPIKGLPLYRVHVPADQVELMRRVANALYAAHSVDVSHMADRVAARVEQMAEDEASEPPEGWK